METAFTIVHWVGLAGATLLVTVLVVRRFGVAARRVGSTSRSRLRSLVAPASLVLLAGSALLVQGWAGEGLAESAARERLLVVFFGLGVTWLVARTLQLVVDAQLERHDTSVVDNHDARTVHTQYRVLERIALILVWTVGVAAVLSTFPAVRALGDGLLASAGIVGLVLGLAAQRTIGNFLAGVQIALTQPIRLDDAVVIDGEWGWIEDITTTYVVVKIWDERRLIVPFTRILESSFQNWTRSRADLIGSVTLWTDHSVDVAAMRGALEEIVRGTDLWDGRVVVLQVVETSERAIQLRALVSASSSPRAWDLRCHVRERLLDHMRREQPRALPRVRAEVESGRRVRDEEIAPVSPVGAGGAEVGGLPGDPGDPGEPEVSGSGA